VQESRFSQRPRTLFKVEQRKSRITLESVQESRFSQRPRTLFKVVQRKSRLSLKSVQLQKSKSKVNSTSINSLHKIAFFASDLFLQLQHRNNY